MSNKAIYIGPWSDFIPFVVLQEINEFIYVDTHPNYDGNARNRKYDNKFISRLYKTALQLDLTITDFENGNIFTHESGRKIKYYMNTNFDDAPSDELKNDMKCAEHLIIAGYDPNKHVFDFANIKIIYGRMDTVYDEDLHEQETSSEKYLYEHPDDFEFIMMCNDEEYDLDDDEYISYDIADYFELICCHDLTEFVDLCDGRYYNDD